MGKKSSDVTNFLVKGLLVEIMSGSHCITLKRSTQQLFSVKYLFGKQILPRISYYLRTTKNL